MKTLMLCLAAITLFITTTINHSRMMGQAPEVVPGDENYSLTLAFHKPDTILVVTPDSYVLSPEDIRDIERYVFWEQYQKKPGYLYKKESDLTATDWLKTPATLQTFQSVKTPGLPPNSPGATSRRIRLTPAAFQPGRGRHFSM